MNDEDIEKLINDMAEEYAANNYECYNEEEDWFTSYSSLRLGFIDGFKAGMKFKEEE